MAQAAQNHRTPLSLAAALAGQFSGDNARIQFDAPRANAYERAKWDLGLGAGSADNLDTGDKSAMKRPIAGLPASLWAARNLVFPMSDTDIAATFQNQVNSFAIKNSALVSDQNASNLISTSTARAPFLARAVGIIAAVNFFTQSIQIQVFPASNAPGTADPLFSGDIPFNAQSLNRPGTFTYGHCSWEFIWALMSAYRLQMFLGGEFRVLDELIRHVGSIESNFTMEGFGSSNRPVLDLLQQANIQARAIAAQDGNPTPLIGQTINTNGQIGVLPPLAQTANGGPCLPGIFGTFFPIRPMLFLPGMPIDIVLARQNADTYWFSQLVNAARNKGYVTIDPNYTGILAGNIGYSGDYQMTLGNCELGTLFRGLNLTLRACLEWYYNYGWPYQSIYSSGAGGDAMRYTASRLGFTGVPIPRNPGEVVKYHEYGAVTRQFIKGLASKPESLGLQSEEQSKQVAGWLEGLPQDQIEAFRIKAAESTETMKLLGQVSYQMRMPISAIAGLCDARTTLNKLYVEEGQLSPLDLGSR